MDSLIVLLVGCSFGGSDAFVEFTHSTLYDIYDFTGKAEVQLPRCDNGCYIYASSQGRFEGTANNKDPYASQLIINDEKNPTPMSIAELSMIVDGNSGQKFPYMITGPTKVKVVNSNGANAKFYAIVLYVIDRKTATTTDFDIYDAMRMLNRGSFVLPDVTTIMSAVPFTVYGGPTDGPNTLSIRLAGFDNAKGTDGCPLAFQTAANSFEAMSLQVTVPIVSLVSATKNRVQIGANTTFSKNQKLANDGIITSPGWNGCSGLPNGQFQVFGSPLYSKDDIYTLDGVYKGDYFSVHLEEEVHNDVTHAFTVAADNGTPTALYGNGPLEQKFDSASLVTIGTFEMGSVGQGFIMRYKAKRIDNSDLTTKSSIPMTTSFAVSMGAQSILLLLITACIYNK
ncbi:hypothetical protein PFISCL1PPCAC_19092 [Pristionchus fissidentatus]|uniref:CUB domain-containing protein n=1 Tax=Pristionchus fissidentatus TaxID=1538716 RepID=A0AAV5WBJ5_9BILA|nr:hypothetical protein PFISCL1PPCAC_19092 [Pristionchus fissidentatus]